MNCKEFIISTVSKHIYAPHFSIHPALPHVLLREIEELSCPWKIISPVETWPEIGNSVADNPGDGSGTLFAEKTYLSTFIFRIQKKMYC